MDKLQHNPLAKYFRAPGIMVRLPSDGNFQPAGNVTTAVNGDVPVLPMRGADEMLMKSPDALMSGHAIEEAIKSCVPNILDVQSLPTCDVDALLLAIRASTYGDQLDVTCTCPHCQTENEYAFSISHVLDSSIPLAAEYPVRLNDDLVVYVGPFSFKTSTMISIGAFQEAKKMQLLEDSDATDEDKQISLRVSMDKINAMNTDALASAVQCVVTPDGMVEDRDFIRDFMDNIGRNWLTMIEEKLKEVNKCGIQKEQIVACSKCAQEFTTSVEFDPSNFFGKGS